MELKIKFYGTRGSIPVCEPQFQKFGGNTTCIGFYHHDRIGIFDAGTGVRAAGKDILENDIFQKNITIVFTHFHWDHIQGLPFFPPAYAPDRVISLLALGESRITQNLEKAITQQMGEEYFPIALNKMGARFNFMMVDRADIPNFYQTRTSSIKLNHPGGCFGYRIEVEGRLIVICTDVEHTDTIDPKVVEFAKDADLLIHDAQYTDEELVNHKGWGHSSFNQAIEVAEMAGVKQLAMTHHDPHHDDEFLEAIEKKCQDRFKDCFLARDGMDVSF
jgi:phosphoribosyl 1,2-cyclic phosphodiesterase